MTKPDKKVTSMKVLIASASVAATVVGWAQLARHNSEVAGAPQQASPQAAAQPGQASLPTLQLDALALPTVPAVPTLVPVPDFSNLRAAAGGASSQAAVVVPTIAPVPPTPIPPQPTPTPRPRPQAQLRQVPIPQPAPRVITRSSR